MKFLFIVIIILIAASIAFSSDKVPSESTSKSKKIGIKFFNGNLKEALDKAKKEKKMVFIDSYTNWCGPCKLMKTNIFPDENFSNYMNENYVCLAINIEKGEGPKIKKKYPHATFPALLFINNDGTLKNRFLGMPTYGAQELLNFAKLASR